MWWAEMRPLHLIRVIPAEESDADRVEWSVVLPGFPFIS